MSKPNTIRKMVQNMYNIYKDNPNFLASRSLEARAYTDALTHKYKICVNVTTVERYIRECRKPELINN